MRTLGQHIATRLVEIGVTHVFGVPGEYWLLLCAALGRVCCLRTCSSALVHEQRLVLAGDFNLVLLDQVMCCSDPRWMCSGLF